MKKAQWQPLPALPDCHRTCENIFALERVKLGIKIEGNCDDCTVADGDACDCKVTCDTENGYVPVGGFLTAVDGLEIGRRICKQVPEEIGKISFDGPPVCMLKNDAGITDQLECPEPDLHESLYSEDCSTCVAQATGETSEMVGCNCKVYCENTTRKYKRNPSGETGPFDLKCMLDEADFTQDGRDQQNCADITDVSDCIKSKDKATGKPCCMRPEGFLENGVVKDSLTCTAKDSDAMGLAIDGSAIVPVQCAASKVVKWEDTQSCSPLCINKFKEMPTVVATDDCDECFTEDANCKCKVTCDGKEGYRFTKTANVQDQNAFRTCDASGDYGEQPKCIPSKQPEIPTCDAPSNLDHSKQIPDACYNCKANGDYCVGCDISCASGYYMYWPKFDYQVQPVQKMSCTKGLFDCPLKTFYEKTTDEEACYPSDDGTTKKQGATQTNYFCCPEVWPTSSASDKQNECKDLNTEAECIDNLENGKACCWRSDDVSDIKWGTRCVRNDSPLITEGAKPEICSDRGRVFVGKWKEGFPKCTPYCTGGNFQLSLPIKVTSNPGEKCDKCISMKITGDPDFNYAEHDCNCEVQCAEGYPEIVGGGVAGKRRCQVDGYTTKWYTESVPNSGNFDTETGGLMPVCVAAEVAPTCYLPKLDTQKLVIRERYSFNVCQAGDPNCKINVDCRTGRPNYVVLPGDLAGGGEGEKVCLAGQRNLNSVTSCADLSSKRRDCLDATEDGRPCCYSIHKFYDGAEAPKCLSKGGDSLHHKKMTRVPDSCADTKQSLWCKKDQDLATCAEAAAKQSDHYAPKCELSCFNSLKGIKTLEVAEECDHCINNQPCPGCKASCKSGLTRVGGGSETEPFTCSTDGTTKNYQPPLAQGTAGHPVCFSSTKLDFSSTTCSRPSIQNGQVRGCTQCRPDQSCSCSMSCDSGYKPTNPDFQESGPFTCTKVGRTASMYVLTPGTSDYDKARPCETKMKDKCLNGFDSASGERCCYHNSGLKEPGYWSKYKCMVKGASDMEETPEACAHMEEEKWILPECQRVCSHNFNDHIRDDSTGQNRYTFIGCDECVYGQPCPSCKIQCNTADGYEWYGGPREGGRKCDANVIDNDCETRHGKCRLEHPPVCMKKMPEPPCWVPSTHARPDLDTHLCNNCVAGSSCGCDMKCKDPGYLQQASPDGVDLKCVSKPRPIKDAPAKKYDHEIARYGSCSEVRSSTGGRPLITDCINAVGKNDKQCCYRFTHFHMYSNGADTKAWQCLEREDYRMSVYRMPDSDQDGCTQMNMGTYEESWLPKCDPICPNIFKGAKTLYVTGACDGCIEGGSKTGGPCDCNVGCVDGTFPSNGAIGLRTCTKIDSFTARFTPDAPICEPICARPSHKDGRLDISQCPLTKECFGDRACNPACKVSCWNRDGYKTEPLGSRSSDTIQCRRVNDKFAEFGSLPKCEPMCEPPDDQFATLDVSRCNSRCYAVDGKNAAEIRRNLGKNPWKQCSCDLQCIGVHQMHSGKTGKKVCAFVKGSETQGARGQWVDADPETWEFDDGSKGRKYYDKFDEMPSCLSPLVVQVNDATNGKVLRDVKLKLEDTDTNVQIGKVTLTRPGFGNLCSSGICAAFLTAARNIKITAMKEGYNDMEENFNRLEMCSADPKQCKLEVNIAKKLKSGAVYPDGCFFVNKNNQVNFKIRAILQWSQHPEDLDIWMRQVQCAESVRKRYECYEKGDAEHDASNDKCQRSTFRTDAVSREAQSCHSKQCAELDNGRGGFETVMREESPDCGTSFPNQFPKWLNWASRYMEKLHKINTGNGEGISTKTGTDSSDWDSAESYLLLDVDQREGYGPETITMHNPPPGDYQIIVHQFSETVPVHMQNNIMAGVPRVELTFGGNTGDDRDQVVQFRCKITAECARDISRKDAHLWQPVTIKIIKSGQVHDEETNQLLDKYNIRLLRDNRQQFLTTIALPTTDTQLTVTRWVPSRFGINFPSMEDYFEFKVPQYSGGELSEICYGECEGANPYTKENFGDCLKGDEFGAPYKVQT